MKAKTPKTSKKVPKAPQVGKVADLAEALEQNMLFGMPPQSKTRRPRRQVDKPVIDVVEDVPAETLLYEIKSFLLKTLRSGEPLAAHIELAIKICDREIPSWVTKHKKDANLDDYKEILGEFMRPTVPAFTLLTNTPEEKPRPVELKEAIM